MGSFQKPKLIRMNNYKLLGEVEQNIVICQWRADQLFAHEHTIICRQLFAGHVVVSRPMKRKKHLHRMITCIYNFSNVGPIPTH